MLVPLNKTDWKIIHQTAYGRDSAHRLAGVFRPPWKAAYGDPTTVKADLQGVVGEFAVHKLFGVPFRDDTTQLSNAYDILLPSGHKGEVKYVSKHRYRFGQHDSQKKHFHTWDVGLLVMPSIEGDMYSDPTVPFCVSHDAFWRLQEPSHLPVGGLSHMIALRHMTPIETLILFEQGYSKQPVRRNHANN